MLHKCKSTNKNTKNSYLNFSRKENEKTLVFKIQNPLIHRFLFQTVNIRHDFRNLFHRQGLRQQYLNQGFGFVAQLRGMAFHHGTARQNQHKFTTHFIGMLFKKDRASSTPPETNVSNCFVSSLATTISRSKPNTSLKAARLSNNRCGDS